VSQIEVLAVASELYPLVKTGGLADVAGALPKALKPLGVRVRTLLPGYPPVLAGLEKPRTVKQLGEVFGGPGRLLAGAADGLELYVLDAPHLYDRPGGPYGGPDGKDYTDNARRFAALGWVAARIGQGLVPRWRPQVVHAHDWQAGLTAAYLAFDGGPRPGFVCTIHNLAFQGQFDRRLLAELGLPPQSFTADGVEYYGDIGFLKAGVRLADRITTVSPTYAAEICTAERGMGMDGLLHGRADRLSGILNGVDTSTWDPATDPLLTQRYDAERLDARAVNKAALQKRLGLALQPDAPLVGVVSRLSWQKGLDLLLAALPMLMAEGAQLAVLGAGEPGLEQGFREAAAAWPGRVACVFAYDEPLAHQIQGGADVLAVPSRFEPCGLTQLCALRYGAVPLVARVGGLADTIIDATPMSLASGAATGVQFAPVETPMLENAIRRTLELYRAPEAWRRLQLNGMATDVSWTQSARRYAQLYAGLLVERGA
jgi:starch synthase